MRDRRKMLAMAGIAVAVMAVRHPTVDLRIVTHNVGDPTPHRFQAAIDFGLVGFSVLYTYTKRLTDR